MTSADLIRLDLTEVPGGTRLRLKVRAGARQDALTGIHGGAVKLGVTAAPEKGKANRAVLQLLARILSLPPSSLELLSGHASTEKTVLVPLPASVVAHRLGQSGAASP